MCFDKIKNQINDKACKYLTRSLWSHLEELSLCRNVFMKLKIFYNQAVAYISQKVSEQLHTLEHAIFSSFTHEPAVKLAERLIGHLPKNQSKSFYY